MQMKGAQIVVQCLLEQGVDTVFGYPGGTILDVYDALYLNREAIRHIRTSHEQGAAHAADGYARASGKTGVVLATSGPGSTNLVTGLATAYMDSVPLVAITCNVTRTLLGKDSFQEVDIAGITMPITKHGFIVKEVEELADVIRRAFRIAGSGRPGPVLVDITKDVTQMTADYVPQKQTRHTPAKPELSGEALERILRMLREAKRPFVYVGGGAVMSGASKELMHFAHTLSAPVCSSLMGKGAFDERDALYTGMIGMHGTKASNFGVSRCDLLIALGARFSDRVIGNAKTFAKHAKVLHIDIDPAEINKNIKADEAVVGDLKEVLKRINRHLEPQRHEQWLKEIAALRKRYPLVYDKSRLTCQGIVEELYRLTKGKAVLTTDVGQHQMWAAQFYRFSRPRTLLTSGGLGTMGFGLGACIGAKTARPKEVCVNIAGDGCFRMNLNELATARSYGIKVIEIVINNGTLGMVRQWQNLFYGGHYSETDIDPGTDYVALAKAFGCEAERIAKPSEVRPALMRALKSDKPYVLDCLIDTDEKVFPMVPAGASIAEAFDEKDLNRAKNGGD